MIGFDGLRDGFNEAVDQVATDPSESVILRQLAAAGVDPHDAATVMYCYARLWNSEGDAVGSPLDERMASAMLTALLVGLKLGARLERGRARA